MRLELIREGFRICWAEAIIQLVNYFITCGDLIEIKINQVFEYVLLFSFYPVNFIKLAAVREEILVICLSKGEEKRKFFVFFFFVGCKYGFI